MWPYIFYGYLGLGVVGGGVVAARQTRDFNRYWWVAPLTLFVAFMLFWPLFILAAVIETVYWDRSRPTPDPQ